jgi:hypothetical protein
MVHLEHPWILGFGGTIGTIVLTTLGWLAVQTYDMRSGLTEVKGGVAVVAGDVKSTSDRVERIAKALPEMGRHIAAEDISSPITTVVISTSPTKTPSGAWQGNVVVIDPKTSEVLKYKFPLRGKDDQSAQYAVIGTVRSVDEGATSFSHLRRASMEMGTAVTFPSSFSPGSSFVLREATPKAYVAVLEKVAGAPVRMQVDLRADNWAQFVDAMKSSDKLAAAVAPRQ